MSDFDPSSNELMRLADKYDTLADLRRKDENGLPPPESSVLRALAKAFPGVLRELDQLTLDEIDRRRSALRRAAEGATREPWMAWIHGYHGALRASLYVKARARAGAERAPAEALAEQASRHAAYAINPELVGRLLDRGRCRITLVALELVAERHGVDVETVRATLLPRATRRRG